MSVGSVFEAHAATFDNETRLSSGWNDAGLSAPGLETLLGTRFKWQPGWEYELV